MTSCDEIRVLNNKKNDNNQQEEEVTAALPWTISSLSWAASTGDLERVHKNTKCQGFFQGFLFCVCDKTFFPTSSHSKTIPLCIRNILGSGPQSYNNKSLQLTKTPYQNSDSVRAVWCTCTYECMYIQSSLSIYIYILSCLSSLHI